MATPASSYDFPTILTLPYDADLLVMCDAGRAVVMSFMNHAVADSWGKQELDAWLRGPYQTATTHVRALAPPGEFMTDVDDFAYSDVADADALKTIWAAHRDTLEFLFGLPDPTGTGTFVVACVRGGLVVRAEDRGGAPCWVPKLRRDQTLGTRVQALIVADFLMRAEDYGSQLSICSRCSRVEFDALSRARGMCLDETRSSVVVSRRDTEIKELLSYR